MSHEIIKKIRVENGNVFLTSVSNNVLPKTFHEWECKGLSEVLQQQGEEQLNFEILKEYDEGNMQPGTPNKWSRAIDRLRHLPEYQKYNWRNKYCGDKEQAAQIEANRQTEEFKKLLLNSLNINPPKTKIILTKQAAGGTVYLLKVTTRAARWTYSRSEAKIFNYEQDTERVKNSLYGGENFKTEIL